MSDVSDRTPHVGVRAVGGALAAAVLAIGLLGACKSGSSPSADGSSSPSASASASRSASGTPSTTPSGADPTRTGVVPPTDRPTSSHAPGVAQQTHRGTVVRGAGPGCLILKAADGQYELVGASAKDKRILTPDATVVVSGYPEKGMMSHCMQGTMFKVVSAQSVN